MHLRPSEAASFAGDEPFLKTDDFIRTFEAPVRGLGGIKREAVAVFALPIAAGGELDVERYAADLAAMPAEASAKFRLLASGLARYYGLDGKPAEMPGDEVPF